MIATQQLNEKLDWISQGKTLEEQINRAKQIGSVDPTFPVFMRMACTESDRLVGLPDGMPETYKPDMAIPDGISETTARQEIRRIKNFMRGGSMEKVVPARRETIWIQMLEGMHWKEAAIMIQIKDQTLFNSYPNLHDVLKTLGVPVSDSFRKTETAKKTPAPKKSAKKTT